MIDLQAILGFAGVSLALALSPGPSWMYVIATTVQQGRATGLLAVLGNAGGIVFHVLAAAAGLSAVLAYSDAAYAFVRWVGAVYLIVLAVRTLRCRPLHESVRTSSDKAAAIVLRDGALVNILNPKVALLMLALLPQFVDPARAYPAFQIVGLGAVHVLLASLVLTTLTLLADRLSGALQSAPWIQRLFRCTAAGVLLGLGVRMALSEQP